jgi:hypothetical protein
MTQYFMLQCFAPLLCYSFIPSPNETRKERDITKLKPVGLSEMQNMGSSTYVDGFTVNTTVKVM